MAPFASLIGLTLGALFSGSASTVHPGESPHCAVRVWNSNDGLPQNSVTDIAKLPDGVFALATAGGLALFNGTEFEVEDLSSTGSFRSNRFLSIEFVPGRGLAAATQDGRLQLRQGQHWLPLELSTGTSRLVLDIKAGVDEDIWLALSGGIQHIARDSYSAATVREGNFSSLAVTSDGRLFAGSDRNDGLWTYADQTWSKLSDKPIYDLAISKDGTPWGVQKGALFRVNPDLTITTFELSFEPKQLSADPLGGL